MNRLQNKVAIVYSDGAVGGAMARAFAREGARVFLAGRTPEKLQSIAESIREAGGIVDTAVVDALDEQTVEAHLETVLGRTDGIDISFNAIGIPQTGVQGMALTELPVAAYMHPIATYAQAHFITGRAAARRMTQQRRGVIMMHIPNAGRISPPFVGGMVPAWATLEALCRSLSVECGAYGVRTVCLLTTGIPETPLIDEVFTIHGKVHGTNYDEFTAVMSSMTHRKRLTTLQELAGAAVFAASDEGAAISGTVLNLTAGMVTS